MRSLKQILLLSLLCSPCFGQAWSGIINSPRAIDWSSVGVPGGIPSVTTQCVNTQCATVTSAGSSATAAQINAALANAPANTYVLLAPGTYTLGSNSINLTKDNVVLRGSGANSTFLVFADNSSCGLGSASGSICVYDALGLYNGNAQVLPPNGIRQMAWTAGFSAGTTSITLNSCGSGCVAPVVGQTIILDQGDDATDNSGIFICGLSTCNNEGVTYTAEGRFISSVYHSQQQIVKVTAISGSGTGPYTVTISPGLYASNWNKASSTPGAWWPGTITGAGIENLSANYAANVSGAGGNGISLYDCYGCWVKGVRGVQPNGQSHVLMYQSSHDTIESNYFYGSPGAEQSYGTQFFETGDSLVHNNIYQQISSPFSPGNGEGNVAAYNFSIDNLFVNANWMQVSYAAHNAAQMFELFEGNTLNGLDNDNDWGTSPLNTFFRNRVFGWERVSGTTRSLNTGTMKLYFGARGMNVIGNVLGSCITSNAIATCTGSNAFDNTYQTIAGGSTTNCQTSVFNLGFRGAQCTGATDTLVQSTLMLWGNYDPINGAVRWDATESSPASSGSGATLLAGNTTPASHTLPASFYLSTKPAWMGSKPFPLIGPDVTGGNATGTIGLANTSPAEDCYRATMGGSSDGSGSVLAFDPTTCYASVTPPITTTLFSGSATFTGQATIQASGSSSVAITSSAMLPGATVGVLYSDTLTATGGTGGYTWTLLSGAFPTNSNFSLSAAGVLSGVPSATATCTGCMTFQVCDTASNCASQAFSITITAGSLAFVNNALLSGTQGAAYSATALMTGGTLPYTACSVFSGSLPTGLSAAIGTSGCVLSGTLGAGATTSSFVLSGTDTASTTVHSGTLSITVTVAGACGAPFFPCGNISATIHPLAQSSNTKPSCFDSPGTSGCKQPVPQVGFANVLGQFTITNPGTCASHPTISFSGGTFTRAGAATGVWSSTNSLTGIVYQDYGAYTVVPTVAFSGGSCATTPTATVALQSASCNGHQCQGGLFGANSVVNGYSGAIVGNDPFYGAQRVLRLTDALVDPTNPNVSYTNDSSAENAQTNYDGTIIKAAGKGGWSDLFSLDYSIWNSAACAIGSTTCNAFRLQLVGKGGNFPQSFIFGQTAATPALPADQTSDNYAFYAFNTCTTGGVSTCARIERWLICGPAGNTSTLCPGGWKAVVDPNWPTTGSHGYDITQASCAGSTYMTPSVVGQGIFTPWTQFGDTAMNGADNRFAAELRIFGGVQDEGGTSATVDTSTGTPRCKILDLVRGTASTDWNNSAPVAITPAACSGSSCKGLVNTLLPPAMPTLSSGGTGSLNAAHTYAVSLSYTLRNSRGTNKSPGDLGETNGSAVSTISGVTKIAIAPPGLPGDALPGVSPVAGQNVPNSDCVNGTQAKICVLPTGFNVFVCDRTASPGCTPVRAQVDQAPLAVSGLSCTPASGNSGSTYTYIYHVTARHLTGAGTTIDYSSQDVSATCTTANPISAALPNALSWTAPVISTSLLYDIDRGSTSAVVLENLIGRIACPASPCTFSDISINPASGEEEIVHGATTTGITISSLPSGTPIFPFTTLTSITSSSGTWNQASGTFYVTLVMADSSGALYKSSEYGPFLFDASHTVHFNWTSLISNAATYYVYWGSTPGGENQFFTIPGGSMGLNSSFGGPGAGTSGTIPIATGSAVAYSGIQGGGGNSTHNIKIDMSGNPVIPTPSRIGLALGFPLGNWFWYPDTTATCNSNFQDCPYNIDTVFYCAKLCPGHRAESYSGQMRSPNNTSSMQIVLGAPSEGQNIISMLNDSPCSVSPGCHAAQHINWSLGVNSFVPYALATQYTATSDFGAVSWPTQLYTGEADMVPSGDGSVSSAVTSISQTGTTVTATLTNSVGCQATFYTLCFMAGMKINTASIPLGVSHSTNWNGQHILTSVIPSTNKITWTSGTSTTDTAGGGGTLNGCGGGAILTGGALSNPNCYAIREGMIYSNGNEATRFYGTPRGFTSQVGASAPLIFASTAYTYWNEAATHFNQNPTALARVSGTVTATFASTANLSPGTKSISVTGNSTGANTTSFKGEFPILSTTGTTITWLQPGIDDTVTPTAGACNGAGTATCVDASDSFCVGSSLGDEYGAPDINMNVATQAGCRTDIIVIEPL